MESVHMVLFGVPLDTTPQKAATNAIRLAFRELEGKQRERGAAGFYKAFSDLDDLYARADMVANGVRSQAIDLVMEMLASLGVYEMSEELFFERFMDPHDTWDVAFEPIATSYEAMLERTAELDAQRTARRQGRAKWVGYSKQGVYQADAKNLISNVGHGVFNLMAKGMTAIGNAVKKDEIFKNPATAARVNSGLADIVSAACSGLLDALNTLKPGSVHLYSESEISRATAIVNNVQKDRIPHGEVVPSLLRAINIYPYLREAYVLLLQHGGGDESRLDAAVQFFGLAPLDDEKKQVFEARRKEVDLSSLDALAAHLPDLRAFARDIVTCPLPPCHSFGESPGLQGNFVGGLVLS